MKIIKIDNLVYENVKLKQLVPVEFDEQDNPTKFEERFIDPRLEDLTFLKQCLKDTLDWLTDRYIKEQIEALGEDLNDLVSEVSYIEGRILFILAKNGITNITTDYIKQKIAQLVGGAMTIDDAKAELNNLKFKDEQDKQTIIELLERAVFIAKILNWKEEIWQIEEKLEEQIEAEQDINKLLNLDLKQLIEKSYPIIGSIL